MVCFIRMPNSNIIGFNIAILFHFTGSVVNPIDLLYQSSPEAERSERSPVHPRCLTGEFYPTDRPDPHRSVSSPVHAAVL